MMDTPAPDVATIYDVAVIGAGPAGTAAALRAAELGARVVVLEADRLGGTCVNTGCVPTRVLAKTARMMREVRTADAYGIAVRLEAIDWPTTVARVQRARGQGALDQARGRAFRGGRHRPDSRGQGPVRRRAHARARQRTPGHRRLDHHLRRRAFATAADPRRRARDRPRARARPPRSAEARRHHRCGQHRSPARHHLQLLRVGGHAARPRAAGAHGFRRAISAASSPAFREQGISWRRESRASNASSRPTTDPLSLHWRASGQPVEAASTPSSWRQDGRRMSRISGLETSASRRCDRRSPSIRSSAPPPRTSSRWATRTAATCSCRLRTSRAKWPPRTPCSGQIADPRITCCPREASPIPITRGWGGPRTEPASDPLCVVASSRYVARPRRHRRPRDRLPQAHRRPPSRGHPGRACRRRERGRGDPVGDDGHGGEVEVSTLASVKFAYPTYSAIIGMAARELLRVPADN